MVQYEKYINLSHSIINHLSPLNHSPTHFIKNILQINQLHSINPLHPTIHSQSIHHPPSTIHNPPSTIHNPQSLKSNILNTQIYSLHLSFQSTTSINYINELHLFHPILQPSHSIQYSKHPTSSN